MAMESMEVYKRIFENNPDPLFVVNLAGQIVNLNARVEQVFGFTRDELLGEPIERLIPNRFARGHLQHRARFARMPTVRQMRSRSFQLYALRKDQVEVPVDIMISPFQVDNEPLVLCAVRDVSEAFAAQQQLRRRTAELEAAHEQMKILASRDGLTELLNRRAFQEQVEWMLRHAVRRFERFSLLMIDLDFFKRVNDQFGHAEGDRVLRAMAETLRATCRQNDLAARFGGEEFAVALPDTDASGGLVAAETLRIAIASADGSHTPVTASIGVATYVPSEGLPQRQCTIQQLIGDADRALYAAKHAGRNRAIHVNSLPPE